MLGILEGEGETMSTKRDDIQREQPQPVDEQAEKSYSLLQGFTITDDAMLILWETQQGKPETGVAQK